MFPKRVIKINVPNVKFKSFTFPVVIVLFLELGRLCEPTAWSQKSVQFQGWVETLGFNYSPNILSTRKMKLVMFKFLFPLFSNSDR